MGVSEATGSPASQTRARLSLAELPKLTSYEVVEDALRSPDLVPGQHDGPSGALVAGSVLTLAGDEHLDRRRYEAALFRKEMLRHYEEELIVPMLGGLIAGGWAELVTLTRTALIAASAAMIGIDGIDTPEAAEEFRLISEAIGRGITSAWAEHDHDKILAEALKARTLLERTFYHDSVARRPEEGQRDLISVLLTYPELSIEDSLLLREVTLFISGSVNTTSRLTPHVVAELEAWMDPDPDRREIVRDRQRLHRAVGESLRLHPPVPALIRRALTPCSFGGVSLNTGDYVLLDLRSANRDQEVFGPDMDQFDPDRVVKGRNGFGVSFGGGAHMCLGRGMVVGTARSPQEADPLGIVVRMLQELYAHGMRPSSTEAPVLDDNPLGEDQRDYLSYPVEFAAT
jgi:cytochrome P450